MDVAFQHFDQWWLVGMAIEQTSGWMPYILSATGGSDITNQFISFGLGAGILGIALFIFVIYRGFSHVGAALNVLRQADWGRSEEALLWGLGVTLSCARLQLDRNHLFRPIQRLVAPSVCCIDHAFQLLDRLFT